MFINVPITLIYFQGSDVIQCILLDMRKIENVVVHGETFKKMDNLRMLMLCYSCCGLKSEMSLASSLVSLPNTLMILYLNGFPQRSLPPNFCAQNLVRLEMPNCHLEQLWEGDQVFHVIYVLFVFRLLKIKTNSTSMALYMLTL